MDPLVSICCLAYNHEPFIRQCLEGFLMQRTNFAFEILIHDDASTDNTANIIREYEVKYPDIVKPIYQIENQYSKGVHISATYNFQRTKGKYIALCEGDDYWIDPMKLQKQVDFLEKNIDYGLVHTNARVYNNTKRKFLRKVVSDGRSTFFDFLIMNSITTATVLFHKSLLFVYHEEIRPSIRDWKMGDYPIWLWFSYHSKIKHFQDFTTVRRLVSGSATNQKNIENQIAFFRSSIAVREFYIQEYGCLNSELLKIKNKISNTKIRKGVLLKSYLLYKEGISDKKTLNFRITIQDRIYGLLLMNKISRFFLSFLLMFRKKVV